MITKFELFTEGILDKLKGQTVEQVADNFRKRYEDGLIDIEEYYKKSKELNFIGPSYDDMIKKEPSYKLLTLSFINLDDDGVKYALEHGASKEIYNRLVKMKEWFLDLITDLEDIRLDEKPNSIFWKKNDEVLFELYLKNMYLIVKNDGIWSVFRNKYKMKNHPDYIKIFITKMVEKHLNWKGFTPYKILHDDYIIRWNNI